MKKLFNLIAPAMLLLSLMSCSKYYINTMSSSNLLKDEKTGEFQYDNDSVKISYAFTGKDAGLRIKVYNKLPVPLFVDWTRSALIFQGKATAFLPDKANLSGDISTTTWDKTVPTTTESTLNGTIQIPKEVSFIPPNSSVEKSAKLMESNIFKDVPDSLYRDREELFSNDGQIKVKVGKFDHSNSPLSFRSYLTLYTQDGAKNNIFSLDKEFFVSKSVITFVEPEHLVIYSLPSADVFYNSNQTGYGKAMTGVGLAAVIAGSAALQPDQTQK
jgi:hypothetical protein